MSEADLRRLVSITAGAIADATADCVPAAA
jgi:hypothetical protein